MTKSEITVYSDGGARGNPGPAASAFILFKDGNEMSRRSKFIGVTTNNVAEYYAVLLAINYIYKNNLFKDVEKIIFNLDSELVVKQLGGNFRIKNIKLKKLAEEIKSIERSIGKNIEYKHIPRTMNKIADSEVNIRLDENR